MTPLAIPRQRLARPGQVAAVRRSIVVGEDQRSFRAIDVNLLDGPCLRLLPDRGLDIAECWYAGRPVHWAGFADEAPPAAALPGQEWERLFFGGLLSTCGLANVGEPSEGHGLHGRFNHLPATDVRVERSDEPTGTRVSVEGTIREATSDGGDFEVRRTITAGTGHGTITVSDQVTNRAGAEAPAPILYHLNFGWPLVGEDCVVTVPRRAGGEAEFGDLAELPGGWARPGLATTAAEPVTVEHVLDPEAPHGEVELRSEVAGLEVEVRWDRATLPRLLQWIDCRPGRGVVAVEPANCGTKGRGHERAQGRLPVLRAGEARTTGVTIDIRDLRTKAGPQAGA